MRNVITIVFGLLMVAGGIGYFVNRNRVDTNKADDKLKTWGEQDTGEVITKVDCPKAKLDKGTTFECAVAFANGTKASITVAVQNDSGDVMYYWTKPITGATKLVKLITDGIKAQTGKAVTVDCGKGLLDIPPDGLKCTAAAGAETGHVLVKFDTTSHQLTWNVVP